MPNVKRQNIGNMKQWTTVFNTFVTIYTQKYPNEAPGLIKYGSVVRELAFQSANWKFYDDNFRQLRQTECLPWDQIHSELYLRARLNKSKVGSGPRVPSKTNGSPFPKEFCWRSHNGQKCAGCSFKQQCCQYGNNHPVSRC